MHFYSTQKSKIWNLLLNQYFTSSIGQRFKASMIKNEVELGWLSDKQKIIRLKNPSRSLTKLSNGTARLKNVNNCLNTNIYSHIETSGGQSCNLYWNAVHFSTPVLIRHLWQLKTVAFLYEERGPTAMGLHVMACGQAWTLKQTYPNYWMMNQSNNTQHIASKFYPFSTVFA